MALAEGQEGKVLFVSHHVYLQPIDQSKSHSQAQSQGVGKYTLLSVLSMWEELLNYMKIFLKGTWGNYAKQNKSEKDKYRYDFTYV